MGRQSRAQSPVVVLKHPIWYQDKLGRVRKYDTDRGNGYTPRDFDTNWEHF